MMRLASNAAAGRKAVAAAVSVPARAASTHAAAASAAPVKLAPRKKFDPKLIYPSKAGHVRICSNTTRDAQQSNLSAEMAHAHRVRIAKLVDDCYNTIEGPPGVEQIWGGTVPMFDIYKRGVHPFDGLRALTSLMPNTPTSCLIRSNSLNSMNPQPADVIDSFIALSIDAGMDVFTNFDANNDPRNHVAVAEAVHKHGGHYQAALSWAVYHPDPTVYNPKWVVSWFRRIVKDLSPHSLYVKDPSGVLTPEMAGVLAREIKAAFPDLPLLFHTHYQTGFAYSTYLEAMRNGANGVECSLGFPDGAGQPYSLSMLRMAEDYGLQTGNPNKAAMRAIAELCKNDLRPLYASANVVRTPSIDVEQTGIAGGQRSILDKELADAGQAHLIPQVDSTVQVVRKEGGLICQVTPVADSYAREAMRRIRAGPGSESKGFTPGYAQILCGELGSTKEPIHAGQRKTALDERAVAKLKAMRKSKKLSLLACDALQGVDVLQCTPEQALHAGKPKIASLAATPLGAWRAKMDELAAPVVALQRQEEVQSRLAELADIKADPQLLASMNLKIAMASRNAAEGSVERSVRNIDDRVRILQAELAAIKAQLATTKDASSAIERYHAVLTQSAPQSFYESLLNSNVQTAHVYKTGSLKLEQVKELLAHCGVITCSPSLLFAPSMVASEAELRAFDAEHTLGLLDSALKSRENTVLWACFSRAGVPNLLQNFLQHFYTGDVAGFFPSLFKGDKHTATHKAGTLPKALAKEEQRNAFLYRHLHKQLESVISSHAEASALLAHLKELHPRIFAMQHRLDRWLATPVATAHDAVPEVMDGAALVSEATKSVLAGQIAALKTEVAQGEANLANMVRASLNASCSGSSLGQLNTQSLPQYDALSGKVRFAPIKAQAQAQATQGANSKGPAPDLVAQALKQIMHKP